MTNQQIMILGTGGTISCARNAQGDLVPTYSAADLLAQLREHVAHFLPEQLTSEAGNHLLDRVIARDIMQLDSSSITLEDIDQILLHIARAQQEGAAAVIVLHGTDSLEETALAVDQLLRPHIPVVFTGAQLPADHPNPDGPGNILASLRFSRRHHLTHPTPQHTELLGRTYICFGGAILPAYGTSKCHTTAACAFHHDSAALAAINRSAAASAAPSATAKDCGTSRSITSPAASRPAGNGIASTRDSTAPPPLASIPPLAGLRVDIVTAYAGAAAELIDPAADGLVLAAMGSGNIPSAMQPAIAAFPGPVVLCSRVPQGPVQMVYGGSGGGAELARLGVRSIPGLRPPQARMQLLCDLARRRGTPAAPPRRDTPPQQHPASLG